MKDKKKCKVWGDHRFKPIGYHYDWPNKLCSYTPGSAVFEAIKTMTILKCTKCGAMWHGELFEYPEQNRGVVILSAPEKARRAQLVVNDWRDV